MDKSNDLSKCPFHQNVNSSITNKEWWPNQLKLNILRQNSSLTDPMDEGFNYKEEFQKLDFQKLGIRRILWN